MSDPGREDVWTDLESLLNRTEAGKDAASAFAGDAGPDVEVHPFETQAQGSNDLSLPFEDLLSELLGSWSDDSGTSIEAASEGEAPVEVPLSSLMARLMEEPQPDSETAAEWGEKTEGPFEAAIAIASLGALHESLTGTAGLAEGAPPAEAGEAAVPPDDSPAQFEAADQINQQAADELPAERAGDVSTEEALLEGTQLEPQAEAITPGSEQRQAEAADVDSLQSAGDVSTEEAPLVESQIEVQKDRIPSSWEEREAEASCQSESIAVEHDSLAALPAEHFDPSPAVEAHQESPVAAIEVDEETPALWTDDLFNALVSGESDEQPNGPWEALASLPAPTPPSFSETMLFEPPLPADALLNWPVMEQGLTLTNLGQEAVTFEEGEAGPEVESDDSLRRLVGQMLAEMAASAAPAQQTPSTDAAVQRTTERFLSFSLAGEVYAVALAGILETDRLPRVTRVPGLPAWAIGVSNLRGAILPVIDLRRLLSLEEAENPQDGRILVVRPLPSASPVVLVVDRLEGVALLAPNELHPAPVWLDSKILPYLAGIGSFKGRLVNVLDLGRLFEATGVTGDESLRVGEAV